MLHCLNGRYLKNVSNFLIGFQLDYVIQLVMLDCLKKSHTYSNRTYLFSISCFIKNTSEVKSNASISECCDEVSLLACSVAAACYFSFIANQYLIANSICQFFSNQSVSQIQINSLYCVI